MKVGEGGDKRARSKWGDSGVEEAWEGRRMGRFWKFGKLGMRRRDDGGGAMRECLELLLKLVPLILSDSRIRLAQGSLFRPICLAACLPDLLPCGTLKSPRC